MRVRKRSLPGGWYPGSPDRAEQAILRMLGPAVSEGDRGLAGIVPHAGWEYSGDLALKVLSRLSRSMDTIVIIGGHLGAADGIMCLGEDAYETPFGPAKADTALRERVRSFVPMAEDRGADNTVEVNLPFVKHLFPDSMTLGLRAPPSLTAVRLGQVISAAAQDLGRRVVVVGSTDLTHYGPGYGFAPAGPGEAAVRWVREVNDRRVIERLVAMDAEGALECALRERSACSAGGAVAALSFARESGARGGSLVGYSMSCDARPAESFVGYAGILYA